MREFSNVCILTSVVKFMRFLINVVVNIKFSGMVDTIFADVAQPDQARIVAINAHNFLKNQGHFVISIKVR